MCLLGIGFQTIPQVPVVILANREESYSRPTVGPHTHPAQVGMPEWLGGTDLRAGGTWLAVNGYGLLAAVTNRPRMTAPLNPMSRGLLCRSLMPFCSVADASEFAIEQLQNQPFAGCNLLITTHDAATVIEFGDKLRQTALCPGLHLITNGDLNDPADRRIERVRAELRQADPTTAAAWVAEAQRVCALRGDHGRPDICLEFPDRGTVSSTIVVMGETASDSRYWYADGAPTRSAYKDLSPLLRSLTGVPGSER